MNTRHIRVFISSTFIGMEKERSHLMTKVFPRIIQLAKSHNVVVTPIDLRWGITEEASKKGETAKICLHEIENSEPYFIGILGRRYGWQPTKTELSVDPKTFDNYPWLIKDTEAGLSMTEIEMQFGALRKYKKDVNAYFYIHSSSSDYIPEEKQQRLINDVRNNSKYPVSDYNNVDELEVAIVNDFVNLLNAKYPVVLNTLFHRIQTSQEYIINRLTSAYTHRSKIETDLRFQVFNYHSNIIFTSHNGCGISSLLANFVQENRNRINIIPIFAGETDISIRSLLRYLLESTYILLELELPSERQIEDLTNATLKSETETLWRQNFNDSKGSLVIIIDEIQSIMKREFGHNDYDASWLPRCNNVEYILSATTQYYNENFSLQHMGFQQFKVEPLTVEERINVAKIYLHTNSKYPNTDVILQLASDAKSKNANVLKLALHELIFHCVNESKGNIWSYKDYLEQAYLKCESKGEYYGFVIDEMFKRIDTAKVALPYIVYSEAGLTEQSIINLSNVTQLKWSQLYCGYNYIFDSVDGHISIKQEFKGLIETGYLKNISSLSVRDKIIAYFEKELNDKSNEHKPSVNEIKAFLKIRLGAIPSEEELKNYISNYEFAQYLYVGKDTLFRELAEQYYICGYNNKLYKLLLNPVFTIHYERNYKSKIIEYWNHLQKQDSQYEFKSSEALDRGDYTNPFLSDYFYTLALLGKEGFTTRAMAISFIEKSISYLEATHPKSRELKMYSRCALRDELTDETTLSIAIEDKEDGYRRDVYHRASINSACTFLNREQYDKAVVQAKTILESLTKDDEDTIFLKAECYRIIADGNAGEYTQSGYSNDDFKEGAYTAYNQLIDTYKELYAVSPDKYEEYLCDALNNYAIFETEVGNFDKAVYIYDLISKNGVYKRKAKTNSGKEKYARFLSNYGGVLTNSAQANNRPAELYRKAASMLDIACDLLKDLYEFDRQAYTKHYADAIFNKAHVLKRIGSNGELNGMALKFYQTSACLYKELKLSIYEARVYSSIGLLYYESCEYENAIEALKNSLNIYNSINDSMPYKNTIIAIIDCICVCYEQLELIPQYKQWLRKKKDLLE